MANLRVDKITSTETFEKTGSVQFDGSGDYLSLAVSSDFQFGSGDFTIECWALAFDEGTDDILGIYNTGDDRRTFALRKDQTESMQFLFSSSGTGGTSIDSADGIISLNTWHHYAVIRKDLEYIIYLDGKKVGSRYDSSAIYTNTNDGLRIGSSYNTDFEGHITNVRIVKGTALYTSNFKPPMRELEVVPGTVLLACQSKTDASLEKTGKTITVSGNAVANELTPGILTPVVKSGGGSAITGSVEFDGTGDYLQVAANSDLSFTGDFTVEYWVYMSKSEADMRQIGSNNYYVAGKNGNWYFGIHNESTPNVYFYTYDGQSNAESVGVTYTSSLNSWYHLAAARVGNTLTIYVNGVKLTSGTISKDLIDGSVGGIQIGRLPSYGYHNGFISNLRIVKGTALYTADFTPPTRELKRVPGTVLLCCQNPNNPLTEATGKTITGYGDLARVSDTGELVQNGHFTSDTNNWTAVNDNTTLSVDSNRLKITGGGSGLDYAGARQEMTNLVKGNKYVLKFNFIKSSGNARAMIRTNTTDSYGTLGVEVANRIMNSEMNATGTYGFHFTALANTMYLNFHAWDSTSSVALFDNISIVPASLETPASNFTPQVGDGRQVTFEGVTKINTDAYFYLPTGDTASRETTGTYNAGTRGVMMGGAPSPSTARSDVIDYITIASTGDSIDFGNLTVARSLLAACADSTRGIAAGGYNEPVSSPGYLDVIDYVTIASTGNALDYGDLTVARNGLTGTSNSVRGVFGGGSKPPSDTKEDTIDYTTIASKGQALDFGNLSSTKRNTGCTGSQTRGIWGGGTPDGSTLLNTMDYVTIASTGNAADFGDITGIKRRHPIGASSNIRGLFAGGTTPTLQNTIDFITMSSMGNSADFGDLTDARAEMGGVSSKIRAAFMGGWDSPAYDTVIDFVQIATTGNAVSFGSLSGGGRGASGGTSNGHGGLG